MHLTDVLTWIVNKLKPNSSLFVKMLVKYLGLTGLKGWLASIFIKKTVKKVTNEAEKAIDKAEGKRAIKELKEEMQKPNDEIDWTKVDKLEREILEGR